MEKKRHLPVKRLVEFDTKDGHPVAELAQWVAEVATPLGQGGHHWDEMAKAQCEGSGTISRFIR